MILVFFLFVGSAQGDVVKDEENAFFKMVRVQYMVGYCEQGKTFGWTTFVSRLLKWQLEM
jgi:hypothetical protein